MKKPSTADRHQASQHPQAAASAGARPSKSTLILFAITSVALLGICIYLLVEDPVAIKHIPVTTQPADSFMQPTDGKSPDAYGRPPGDPHYGHSHP